MLSSLLQHLAGSRSTSSTYCLQHIPS
uniref:Uncharacterized protein n=1 Tax=Chenopodium quinoa TaxID=63459 RepID=A0A803N424_CHEQI